MWSMVKQYKGEQEFEVESFHNTLFHYLIDCWDINKHWRIFETSRFECLMDY